MIKEKQYGISDQKEKESVYAFRNIHIRILGTGLPTKSGMTKKGLVCSLINDFIFRNPRHHST